MKQTLMLADKSGLRKKPKGGLTSSGVKRKEYTPLEKEKLRASLFQEIAKKVETDEQRAERIRNELKSKRDGK